MSLLIKGMDNFFNAPAIKKTIKEFQPANTLETITLASVVSKDLINTVYYVTQSMNNEKIPEEKRSFVAALDLSNGILNVTLQTAIGLLLKKNSDKLFDSLCASRFVEDTTKHLDFSKNIDKARKGFGVFATLVVTQVITKRIIVPLIATPMASMFKSKFAKNNGATGDKVEISKDNQSVNRAIVDSTTPASTLSATDKSYNNYLDRFVAQAPKK